MYIQRGEFELHRLASDDLELVRKWRNHPEIQENMVYREHISKEMQEKWYETINNNENLYFILTYKGEKIGLLNGKDIDWQNRQMESGIFIWDKHYRKTHIPAVCTIIFAELFIYVLGLKPMATVLRKNQDSLKYNKMLGFVITEDDPAKEYLRLALEIDKENPVVETLKDAVRTITKTDKTAVVFEQDDITGGLYDLARERAHAAKIISKEEHGDTIRYYF